MSYQGHNSYYNKSFLPSFIVQSQMIKHCLGVAPTVFGAIFEAGVTPQSAIWKPLSKVINDQRSHLH